MKQIWFDMDGTIADLYGVENWLEKLVNSDPSPYAQARPLVNMNVLARRLNKVQKNGYQIGVISWLSKNGTDEYNEMVTKAKQKWLSTHLKSVKWDNVDIVPYGTPKQNGRSGILFDDEEQNRKNWQGTSYKETDIMKVLKEI